MDGLSLASSEAPQLVDVTALSAMNVAIGDGIGIKDKIRISVETFHLYVDVAAPFRIAIRLEWETGP